METASTVAMEYEQRLERVRRHMRNAGADLLVVDQAEVMQWLGGFTSSETLYRVLLVPASGNLWYVIRDIDIAPCEMVSWINDIVSYPDHLDSWQFVVDSIIDRGYEQSCIAMDFHSYGCTVETWSKLQAGLPHARFVDLGCYGDHLRQVKFPSEIDYLRQASEIADRTMHRIVEQIKVGNSARDATAIASSSFVRLGADSGDSGPIVRSAGDKEFLHAHQLDEPLTEGDVLHVELIPKVRNYSARLMRPIVIGEPSTGMNQLAQQLISLQDEQIKAMCPGADARDIDRIVRQGVLDAGLRAQYTNVTGYSLGLYARTPRLSDFSRCFHPTANWQLEENMVFHMYISAGRLGFSESVRVGAKGGERLTQADRCLFYSSGR